MVLGRLTKLYGQQQTHKYATLNQVTLVFCNSGTGLRVNAMAVVEDITLIDGRTLPSGVHTCGGRVMLGLPLYILCAEAQACCLLLPL